MVWATSSPQPLERWPGDTAGTASTCPICRQSARSKQPERVQPRLTGPEFHALVQALGSRLLRKRTPRFLIARDTAILQVLVETGLRAAELCALNVGDIDFQEGSVMVRCGKGRKDRAINILDPDPNETDGGTAPRALADYLSYREKMDGVVLEPALWLTPKGNRLNPNVLRAVLRKLCRDAGLSGNRPPHAFRRGWFTASYQADPNALPVLSARMGWSSARRTYRRSSGSSRVTQRCGVRCCRR